MTEAKFLQVFKKIKGYLPLVFKLILLIISFMDSNICENTDKSLPSVKNDEFYGCGKDLDSDYESNLSDQAFSNVQDTEGVKSRTKICMQVATISHTRPEDSAHGSDSSLDFLSKPFHDIDQHSQQCLTFKTDKCEKDR